MYMEDLDLSRSFHRHYETIFYPEVEVTFGFRSESRINMDGYLIQKGRLSIKSCLME
jgi:hypothetical protein